jgi:hypothetical protein
MQTKPPYCRHGLLVRDNPMQPLLAGALMAMLDDHGRELMKIARIEHGSLSPTGFEVRFASGLKLGVKVVVLEEAPEPLPEQVSPTSAEKGGA